jgi:ubiquinone/menaquinone biosynthesis C-methylase UbiE
MLVRAGCEVTGIDVSATMIDLARSQVPGAHFEQRDVRAFTAPAGSFDAICAFFPLLQMPRADLDTTLERIGGWLAPGGFFVMCTTVEPDASREQTMRDGFPDITVLSGKAEQLPFPDDSFDAVVATWVLHYTDDPAAAAAEMARVLDIKHPAAKVVIVQGTPDNQVVDFLNRASVPLAGEQPDHQGLLLTIAARELAAAGLEDISFHRVGVRLRFDEANPVDRAQAAAAVLADFWYTGHLANEQMRQALLSQLTQHFGDTHTVGDDAVMLIATPRRPHPASAPIADVSETAAVPAVSVPAPLAFSLGIHYCPAAAYSRTLAELMITALTSRLPGLRLDGADDDDWTRSDLELHGLHRLFTTW